MVFSGVNFPKGSSQLKSVPYMNRDVRINQGVHIRDDFYIKVMADRYKMALEVKSADIMTLCTWNCFMLQTVKIHKNKTVGVADRSFGKYAHGKVPLLHY